MKLLETLKVGDQELRNRVLSAPMERNLCTRDGRMTDEYTAYLEARAAGGTALIFTEAAYVRVDGKGRARQMGMHDDYVIEPLAAAVDAVHRHGALVGVELNHGGRTAQGSVSGFQCVAPSPLPCMVMGGEVPLELDTEEIVDLIEQYGAAAARCVAAGVDVIAIHCAHGYLIHQFMSPRTNLRTDEYADRGRFLNEVIRAVHREAGGRPISLRISALEGPEDGLDADATLEIFRQAPLDLVDLLDISAGSYEAGEWIIQPGEWPEALLADYAVRYREFGLPISVAGRINRAATVEELLASGKVDAVSMARALHAEPDWVRKVAEGTPPRPCIACNLCIDQLGSGEPIPCSVNPDVGREAEVRSSGSRQPLRVDVVGAGPSGLESARVLAGLGHQVRLFDRQDQLGGEFRLAASLHEYPEYHRIIDWYGYELERLRVDVNLGTEVTAESLVEDPADVVIVATGGEGVLPAVEGIGLARVHEIRSWLAAGKPDLGEDVHFVWGADREGVAVADELVQQGKTVAIVGGQHDLAPDVGRRAKILVVPRLKAHPRVSIHLDSRVLAIEAERMLTVAGERERWLDGSGPILVSQGVTTPEESLLRTLRRLNHPGSLHAVGEAGGQGGYVATEVLDAAVNARAIDAAAPLVPA